MQDHPAATPDKGEDQAIAQLIASLSDTDEHVRAAAAYELAYTGAAHAVEALIPLLADPVAEVRANATYALYHLGGARAAEAALPLLADPVPIVRMEAALAVGQYPEPRALEPLLTLLHDQDAGVREFAAQYGFRSLGEIARPHLLNALADARSCVRSAAARALGWLVSRDALWAVPPDMLGRYPYALSAESKAQVVVALMAATRDEDATVRYEAIDALGRHGDPRAAAVLVPALSDADPDIRAVTIEALHQCGVRSAVPLLVAALADVNPTVRRHAAMALGDLGDLGDERVLSTLEAVQQLDVEAFVREAATSAMARLRHDRL
jgi:HEAT repeat protein